MKLGVNIDHIATLRQARHTPYPDLVRAVGVVEEAGADGITMHLREDRRHIQDADVYRLREVIRTKMNLEMAATDEMMGIALDVHPDDCCLVPERREELTTEGGLDVKGQLPRLSRICQRLEDAGIRVSLFIEPDDEQIRSAAETGASTIEIHTGHFANLSGKHQDVEYERIVRAVELGTRLGLVVNAGHGLDYANIRPIAEIQAINELNIGHSIVSEAVFCGLAEAVRKMKKAINS
ncbi:MAG: pyridoxine 5'-phosphate synthase [Gammaproteobacteria bacterium]|nr:MAG: pyridoxine 5'-phosphate synthase [Gammaproteobacteria bacterium]